MTRIALIGLGMVAGMHAAAIQTSTAGLALTGVHSRTRARADAFAKGHGGPRVFDTWQDIAQAGDVDMVIVATPPDARTDMAHVFAEARIPTLFEKPLERDTARASAIVAAFEATQTPCGAVLQHRMRDAAQTLKTRLPELGQIGSVELRVPWWRPQSYYDAPGRGTYARDGGGVLITQAIHTLDLMLHLVGPVQAVQAVTTTTPSHQMEAEDFAAAAIRFQNGAGGSIVASTSHYPGYAEEIVINGTKGSAFLSSDHLSLAFQDGRSEEFGAASATGGGADPMAFSADWHRAVIEDFAHAIATGSPPAIPARDALAVHRLIDAITASARQGTRVEIAP